jgi:hypothetical protein
MLDSWVLIVRRVYNSLYVSTYSISLYTGHLSYNSLISEPIVTILIFVMCKDVSRSCWKLKLSISWTIDGNIVPAFTKFDSA